MPDNSKAVPHPSCARAGDAGSAGEARRRPPPAELGESAIAHVFRAGLHLNVVLAQAGDDAIESRLRGAIGELDEAVRDLRNLMLAVPGAVTGTPPEGPAGSCQVSSQL
jgi:hypothetical protein